MATPSRLLDLWQQQVATLCSTTTTIPPNTSVKVWLKSLPIRILLVELLWYSTALARAIVVLTTVPVDLLLSVAILTILFLGSPGGTESRS